MISRFVDWILSPLTRRVRREVEVAIQKTEYERVKRELRKALPVVY